MFVLHLNFMTRLVAGTIIEKDGKILMLRRAFEPGKNKLDLAGGLVDKNETPEQAAVREAKEETGFDVKLIAKLGIFDYFDREEKTIHAYIGKIAGGKLASSVEGKPGWIDFNKLKFEKLAFPQQFKQILDAYKKYRKSSATTHSKKL